jgi:hypothetical protein
MEISETNVTCIQQAVSRIFHVTDCQVKNETLVLVITSSFPLAYGALKDMADLIIDEISNLNLSLLNAVIERVNSGPTGLLADVAGGRISHLIGKVVGIKRYTPLMYFYQNMIIDLQITSRLKHINMNPVAELN